MLSTMLFADEIVPTKELKEFLPGETELNEKEINMANLLIDSMIVDFEPTKYQNEYFKDVMTLIEKKASDSVVVTEPVEDGASVVTLMAALEASMAQIKQNKNKRGKNKTSKSA